MKYTTEDVALRVLESLTVGGMSKALMREHDAEKLVRRAFVFADKFIAERDQRRAEVARLSAGAATRGPAALAKE